MDLFLGSPSREPVVLSFLFTVGLQETMELGVVGIVGLIDEPDDRASSQQTN